MSAAHSREREIRLAWEFHPEGGDWTPVEVPGPWQRTFPDFHGKGTYRATLKRSDAAPLFLKFEAVATEARVFINGSEAGYHLGGWTPFYVDATPHLHADPSRANEIVVEVDEKPEHATAGFLRAIGAGFGGIWGRILRVEDTPSCARREPIDTGIRVDGERILHRGRPLQLRGMLHWGYYPELGAPMPSRGAIEAEVAAVRSLGFNMIKFCLFIPPECYLDVCDEQGMWVWQEYPVWERPLEDPALLGEFEEFFRRDSRHSCVIVRTFTCENEHVDADLAHRLHNMAREFAPHGLVLDNSAWISNRKAGDFWDEHPYLHNSEWRHYPERMRRALAGRPEMPLLLGETMAVDTWNDLQNVEPLYAESQRALEREIDTAGILGRSFRIANRVRKYQIETLRRELPHAGYAVNAIRDIPQAPLGFGTEDGRPKFEPRDWAWLGDTMILCDLHDRSCSGGDEVDAGLWVSHFGADPLEADLRVVFAREERSFPVRIEPGETRQAGTVRLAVPEVDVPRAFPLEADIAGAGATDPAGSADTVSNMWNLWAVPRGAGQSITVAETLDAGTLRAVEDGATRIHTAGPRAGSWKCPNFTWWSPVIRFGATSLPEELIEELIVFDLLGSRVLEPAEGLVPVIELLDAHMETGKVVRRPIVGATRLGKGKLVVSALRHDTPAGLYLLERLAVLAVDINPPRLERFVPADSIVLEEWERTFDLAGNSRPTWEKFSIHDAPAVKVYEGWARFRTRLDIPEAWHREKVILRCEAVGDAFIAAVDGREIGRAGNMTGTWDGCRDRPQEFPLRLDAGEHELAFDVRDWRGNGGMIGPVFLTRTPDATVY